MSEQSIKYIVGLIGFSISLLFIHSLLDSHFKSKQKQLYMVKIEAPKKDGVDIEEDDDDEDETVVINEDNFFDFEFETVEEVKVTKTPDVKKVVAPAPKKAVVQLPAKKPVVQVSVKPSTNKVSKK